MPGTLVYFDLGARGELIRAICHLKNFEYTEETVDFE